MHVRACGLGWARRVASARASLMAVKAVVAWSSQNDVVSAFLCGGEKLVEWLKNCGTVWDETVVEVDESEELSQFTE